MNKEEHNYLSFTLNIFVIGWIYKWLAPNIWNKAVHIFIIAIYILFTVNICCSVILSYMAPHRNKFFFCLNSNCLKGLRKKLTWFWKNYFSKVRKMVNFEAVMKLRIFFSSCRGTSSNFPSRSINWNDAFNIAYCRYFLIYIQNFFLS